MKDQQNKDILAPRPVHPTAIRHHGLFGATFVKEHMVIDERWSAGALIDEYHGMTNLLNKRLLFKKLESKAFRKQLQKSVRNLRTQCRTGRTKLQRIVYGNNVKAIRNSLINHKNLQRLYQKMPVHLVVDNINQRTFLMRKERDRLTYRLNQLKEEYRLKLIERANIESRIKYQNEFVLDEQQQINESFKKVENSHVRLKAYKTINSTYKKIIQILRHDQIFYEPILRSLCKDTDDQANFIKHILHLGMPAISKFKQLSDEYKQLEDKSRKSTQSKIQQISSFRKVGHKVMQAKTTKDLVVNISKRYTRETKSMLKLKNNLEEIETVIKQIKMATLCSHAKEIFPRIKSQVESNFKLIKQNDIGHMLHEFLTFKENVAEEKQSFLMHNFFHEEELRLKQIKELKEQIKAEDVKEEKTLAYMKSRADMFVLLRFTLWNLSDILRYVGRPTKVQHIQYPNSYLKLPLLKFEMLTMRAYAPDIFEENGRKINGSIMDGNRTVVALPIAKMVLQIATVKVLLSSVQEKLRLLMAGFVTLTGKASAAKATTMPTIQELWQEYHTNFLASMEYEEMQEGIAVKTMPSEEDLFESNKTIPNVPNRKQIKMQSAKIVEELSKKED